MGFRAATDYATDFWQRSLIFLDILRQSGNQQAEMTSRPVNAVLIFDYEVILRGDSLPRPVNYALVRVVPPQGTVIDETKRPVVVIDPRAGQGPGIGGFKPVSEIGQAFEAGHPVYFIGFIADPVEGQTIEDIAHAHTVFLQKVIELHPQAVGKPFLIGNCQAGWHAIMAACMRPDLVGPVVTCRRPLVLLGRCPRPKSDAVHRRAARRDLDRAPHERPGRRHLRRRLADLELRQSQSRQYALDQAVQRLGQAGEGGGTLPRASKSGGAPSCGSAARSCNTWSTISLSATSFRPAQIVTKDGIRLDIRNIKSPILCFCSKADNITPPQQALDWILDNYDSVDEIREHGQTILYCLHETAGHLAIFVGTKVAAKEHSEFINYMDLIDGIPPGLYEIVITNKSEGEVGAELLAGDFNVRIEERAIEDIRALGCNSIEDEREFEAVARVSELNNALYSTFVQPWLKTWVTPQMASAVLAMQPLRVQYALFSDKNPMMRAVAPLADKARAERKYAGHR